MSCLPRLTLGIVVAWGIAAALTFADPPTPAPAPTSLETALVLQKAMVLAKACLRNDDAKKAVEVLEQNLAVVNGNTTYLELLRDAYRAYIKDLALKNQSAAAQKYLQRLTILDPAAAHDPTLLMAEGPKFVPAAPKETSPPLPNYAATHGKQEKTVPPTTPTATPAAPPKIEVTSGARAPVFRAIRERADDDPFDDANQRIAPGRIASFDPAKAAALLSKANNDFQLKRYADARQSYEQFVQIDAKNLDQVRDRLAYCMLDDAAEQLNRGGAVPLGSLRKQVVGAVAMAPQLRPAADQIFKELDLRDRSTVAGSMPNAPLDPPLNMQHFGKNPQGWMVTETTNFRIFHNQSRDLVERVALIAERTRVAMGRKWFGAEGEKWSPKCELVLHATASDYSRLTGVPANSPGHSRIETDPTTYRIIGRRIDLHTDTLGMLEAVLPHETTHVVLAGNFGQHQVPRWADEGVAVLTEPLEKIEQHRRNLSRGQKDGLLMPVRDLMNLQNYPQANQISAFYAQSVMLVDFLTQQRGPQVFTEFLREGLNAGYEPALRKHYGWSFAELQTTFDQQMLGVRQTAAK